MIDFQECEMYLFSAIEKFQKGGYLPPPNAVRLDVEEVEGQFFQFWLLCGPFPNVNWEARTIDYLKTSGGESRVRPFPGMIVANEVGDNFRWSKHASPFYAEIKLADLFEKNIDVVAYAYCSIDSPVEQKVRATFGSNDGITIICNGETIFSKHQMRNLMVDEDECWLPLIKGVNHILLKIDQKNGGWGFSFRLPDVSIRNHKQKYRIVN